MVKPCELPDFRGFWWFALPLGGGADAPQPSAAAPQCPCHPQHCALSGGAGAAGAGPGAAGAAGARASDRRLQLDWEVAWTLWQEIEAQSREAGADLIVDGWWLVLDGFFFGGIWMEDVKFKIEDFEMYDV